MSDKHKKFCAAYPDVHPQVKEFFPDYDYRHPVKDAIVSMRDPKNCTGHQQRAHSVWWAVECCSPLDLGIDMGSSRGMSPFCLHVDVNGNGKPHPYYGGGPYLADVCYDAVGVDQILSPGAFPLIVSNHSLEHMKVPGDNGVVRVIERWMSLLKPGGVLAMVIPDNAYWDVMAGDKDHAHAWSHEDFRSRVLDRVLAGTQSTLEEYNTFNNHFSFDVVLRKR